MDTKPALQDYQVLAGMYKALAHPARLVILQYLAKRGTCVCGDVVDILPLSQATVSQHLKVLLQAGLITGRIDGQNSCYCLNTHEISRLRQGSDTLSALLEPAAEKETPCPETTMICAIQSGKNTRISPPDDAVSANNVAVTRAATVTSPGKKPT